MKKIVSLLFVLVFVVSLPALAFADGDLLNYRWVDVEKSIQETFGSAGNVWQIEEVDASIWLPAEYLSMDPSQVGLDSDCINLFSMEGGYPYILVSYRDAEGLDLDSYYNYRVQEGLKIKKILVNDIPAIYQDSPENDSFLLMFQTQEGKFLQFIFSPLSNPINGIVMCSIRPNVVAVEETTDSVVTPVPVNPVSGLISK